MFWTNSGDELPHLKAWHNKLARRPDFQKALKIPVSYPFSDEAVLDPKAQELYQKIRKYGGQMIKGAIDHWQGHITSVPLVHTTYEV